MCSGGCEDICSLRTNRVWAPLRLTLEKIARRCTLETCQAGGDRGPGAGARIGRSCTGRPSKASQITVAANGQTTLVFTSALGGGGAGAPLRLQCEPEGTRTVIVTVPPWARALGA
jgi:hypothetical protein